MRYNFTRAQQREMWKRCHVDGVPRCECIWPATSRMIRGKRHWLIPPGADLMMMPPERYRCNAPLQPRRFTYDHTDPTYIAARRVTAADGQAICRECDKRKYTEIDRPKIDKTRRLHDRERGIKKPRRVLMPGSRGSGLRRRYDRRLQRFVTVRE